MNFQGIGTPIFKIIKKGDKKNKHDRIVYITDKEIRDSFESIEPKSDEEFVLIPRKGVERDIVYASGKSGSGKTYFTRKYAEEYHKMYKDRDIYLFSLVQDDPSINLKYVKRIDLNKLLNTPLTLTDFSNSLVIYDDVDCVKDKQLKLKLQRIANQIMEMGRHHNISFAYLSHLTAKGNETKTVLNECSHIVLYPVSMHKHSWTYITDNYIGLDKKQRKELYELGKKNRSICYIQQYPPVIFTKSKVYMPKVEED